MSIRLIAKEMYRLFQESEKIRRKIENSPVFERTRLEEELRKIAAEQERLRRTLSGAIDKG
jgi:hypothetical protein